MITALKILASAVIGYLLGSVSTGVFIARWFGNVDIRKVGSGNVGMTNLMRTMGWLPGALTFLGDAVKGVLAAWLGYLIAGQWGLHLGGVCAVVGHNWSIYFRFKGGKGMSTSFGYLLMANWGVAVALLAVQVVIVLITGYMSLASIVTACLLFIISLFTGPWPFMLSSLILCAMALYGHRENIKRLAHHRENKLDAGKINNVSRKILDKLKNGRKEK